MTTKTLILLSILAITCFNIGVNAAKHGEAKTGSSAYYNFWVSLIGGIIELALIYLVAIN
jgi:hypothetical protein